MDLLKKIYTYTDISAFLAIGYILTDYNTKQGYAMYHNYYATLIAQFAK